MLAQVSAAISASRNRPAPKCGMMNGTGGNSSASRRHAERIAEPQIEAARKPQLLPDADRQHAAVDEHRRARALGGDPHHLTRPVVVEWHVVHCRKEADGAQPELAKRAPRRVHRIGRGRIEHEEADEAIAVARDGGGDGILVAGNARDQRRSFDAVAHRARRTQRSASAAGVPGASHCSSLQSASASASSVSLPGCDAGRWRASVAKSRDEKKWQCASLSI